LYNPPNDLYTLLNAGVHSFHLSVKQLALFYSIIFQTLPNDQRSTNLFYFSWALANLIALCANWLGFVNSLTKRWLKCWLPEGAGQAVGLWQMRSIHEHQLN